MEHLGGFGLRPDQLLDGGARFCVDRAAHAAGFLTEQSDGKPIGFGVGAGGDRHPVPGVGPGDIVAAVAGILGAAAPAIAIIIDAGHQEVAGLVVCVDRQLHVIDRMIGAAVPANGVFSQRCKAVCAPLGCMDGQNLCIIQMHFPAGAVLLKCDSHEKFPLVFDSLVSL